MPKKVLFFYEESSDAQDRLNLARALFDLKEYKKCGFVIGDANSAQAVYLKTMASYLISEQLLEEEHMESGGAKHKVNSSLSVDRQLAEID